jgi:hypothetical protein
MDLSGVIPGRAVAYTLSETFFESYDKLLSRQPDSRLIAQKIVASATRRGYAGNGQLTVFSTVSLIDHTGLVGELARRQHFVGRADACYGGNRSRNG